MRRAARPLLYGGVLVVVFGLALVHARGPQRLLLHRHQPLRLDDRLRRAPVRLRLRLRPARRAPVPPGGPGRGGRGRRSSAPPSISLHPALRRRRPAASLRGVRLGPAPARLVPDLRGDGRRRPVPRRGARPGGGGRPARRGGRPRARAARLPERPASIVASLSPPGARGPTGTGPDRGPAGRRAPHRARARPGGPGRARHRGSGGVAPRRGVRVRSLTLFYEEWLGQAARSPSSSGPRCSSTSARCTAPATAGPSG